MSALDQKPSDVVRPYWVEDKIDKRSIINVPMRYSRTNRGEGGALVAKSRLAITGHTDPTIGLYRTDAPTTSHLAMLLTAVIAINIPNGRVSPTRALHAGAA